jgi:hypothetical protein
LCEFKFRGGNANPSVSACFICLEPIDSNSNVLVFGPCRHSLHEACAQGLARRNEADWRICGICRAEVLTVQQSGCDEISRQAYIYSITIRDPLPLRTAQQHSGTLLQSRTEVIRMSPQILNGECSLHALTAVNELHSGNTVSLELPQTFVNMRTSLGARGISSFQNLIDQEMAHALEQLGVRNAYCFTDDISPYAQLLVESVIALTQGSIQFLFGVANTLVQTSRTANTSQNGHWYALEIFYRNNEFSFRVYDGIALATDAYLASLQIIANQLSFSSPSHVTQHNTADPLALVILGTSIPVPAPRTLLQRDPIAALREVRNCRELNDLRRLLPSVNDDPVSNLPSTEMNEELMNFVGLIRSLNLDANSKTKVSL